jgi:hypothetical protein
MAATTVTISPSDAFTLAGSSKIGRPPWLLPPFAGLDNWSGGSAKGAADLGGYDETIPALANAQIGSPEAGEEVAK